jgi:hypothetical protein
VNTVMKLRVEIIYVEDLGGGVPDSIRALTEQTCSTVTFGTFLPGACISNYESDAICPEIYRVFPRSLPANGGIIPETL